MTENAQPDQPSPAILRSVPFEPERNLRKGNRIQESEKQGLTTV